MGVIGAESTPTSSAKNLEPPMITVFLIAMQFQSKYNDSYLLTFIPVNADFAAPTLQSAFKLLDSNMYVQ